MPVPSQGTHVFPESPALALHGCDCAYWQVLECRLVLPAQRLELPAALLLAATRHLNQIELLLRPATHSVCCEQCCGNTIKLHNVMLVQLP